jgi:DNA polymerase bacteriophage-type
MRTLSLDYETFSELDLKKVGLHRYASHPSTEVLMCAYAVGKSAPKLWVPAKGEPMPDDLRYELQDPDVMKLAWNAAFEASITEHVIGITSIQPADWRCSMVLAYSLALPGSLDTCGRVVGLPVEHQKDSRGKNLIRMFCQPRKPTKTKPHTRNTHLTDPESWDAFEQYCLKDVISEQEVLKLIKHFDMSDEEWALYALDQEINNLGIPINRRRVENAIKIAAHTVEDRIEKMKEITGVENPGSPMQLLTWLNTKGYPFFDLKKGHVVKGIDMTSGDVKKVLEYRAEISKSSVKKYVSISEGTSDDGNLRGAFQFVGAGRTGRWAGRRLQPQNLPRPSPYLEKVQEQVAKDVEKLDPVAFSLFYDKPMDALATAIRPSVEAPPGYVFVDADLNAIENRVAGWVCKEQKILDVFLAGRDPYVDFGTHMTGRNYEDLWHEFSVLKNKTVRTLSKPPVLGCAYRLGPGIIFEDEATGEENATGLLGYAWNMGVKMTLEESTHAVKVWRDTYSKVVDYWFEVERAAKQTVSTGIATKCGPIRFDLVKPFLRMQLPSGRYLYYCRPSIEMVKTPWGAMKATLTYEQMNDKNQWVRTPTQGGKLLENAVQAIARDLLAHGMVLARQRGIIIRLHVHDQIIGMVREVNQDKALKILIESMSTTPTWARGLPLAAEGVINKMFFKD